jgi:hypothetical protein
MVRTGGIGWAVVVALLVGSVPRQVNEDARAFVLAVGVVAIVFALGAAALAERAPFAAPLLLVVASLCAPTFAAAAIDLIPLAVGVVTAFAARRRVPNPVV